MSTILLADDDQLLRLIMRERLERAGHEVLECGDGFAALEIAMDEPNSKASYSILWCSMS